MIQGILNFLKLAHKRGAEVCHSQSPTVIRVQGTQWQFEHHSFGYPNLITHALLFYDYILALHYINQVKE